MIKRILYFADVKKELDVSLLPDFALGHGCLFKVKGNSDYQFYSHKFDWLEDLLNQLGLDRSIIYKANPISIEEEFALKPINPKERRNNRKHRRKSRLQFNLEKGLFSK